MPLFTPGTYWQDCFSHVALFLQQLINILSDDLERRRRRGKKKRHRTHTQSDITLIMQPNAMNIYILLLIQIHPTKAN